MIRLVFLSLALAVPCWAQQKAPPEEKGSIDSSGKFVPKGRQQKNVPADDALEARKKLLSALKAKDLGNGRYRIGSVTLDKAARTVAFPVKVNMVQGVVEYIVVHEKGKVHESVLTTAARPVDIHLACLLLGQNAFGPSVKWPKDHTALPAGHSVKLELTWPTNGPDKHVPLASCLLLAANATIPGEARRPYPAGPWLYNGSQTRRGVFAAETEGSVVSIIGDATALINGMRQGHNNDDAHVPNAKVLPRKGRTVKLVISIPREKTGTKAKQ